MMQTKILMMIVAAVLGDAAFSQDFAARVLKRKRYAQEVKTPDPNAPAKPPAAMEEDLLNPSAGQAAKPIPSAPQTAEPPTPPRELPEHTKSFANPPPAEPPPRFEEIPTPQGRAGDIDEDGDVGVALGIGFGSKAFSASLGLTLPIYEWLAWGVAGSYVTRSDDGDKEVRYGPEGSLMVRLQTRMPITPFAGVGVGFDKWVRSREGEMFDDASSLTSLYFAGISIPMARRLAINISQTWKTYLETPPRRFEDHSRYEPYGSTRFDVGLSVHF